MTQTVEVLAYRISAIVRWSGGETECGAQLAVSKAQLDRYPPDQQAEIKHETEQEAHRMLLQIVAEKGAIIVYYTDADWHPETVEVERNVDRGTDSND